MIVKELIKFLQEQPEDARIVLVDPDTTWLLAPQFLRIDKDGDVYIVADYGDRL